MKNSDARIEDVPDALQITFGTKMVGGSVLNKVDAKQTEIQFLIKPELLVARLILESLGDDESLVIYGARQVSTYKGYDRHFKRTGDCPIEREIATIGSMDPILFQKSSCRTLQFTKKNFDREIRKVFLTNAASNLSESTKEEFKSTDNVVTGNWGKL